MTLADVTSTPQRRPAESAGVAGSLALLVGHLLGLDDPDTLVALGVVLGAVPAGVTWVLGLFRHRPA